MKTGAVALIDALGFRGIWQRYSADEVVNKLRALEQIGDTMQEEVARICNDEKQTLAVVPQLAFLSDTIVVGVHVDESKTALSPQQQWICLVGCSFITSGLMRIAAMKDKPSLAYRGCIAVGKFYIDNPFMVGPAIDDAAEHMGAAEGAFVWLTPSALTCCESAGKRPSDYDYWARYQVPLKGGARFETLVVNPLLPRPFNFGSASLQAAILATFSTDRLDVVMKKQNTEAFLRQIPR